MPLFNSNNPLFNNSDPTRPVSNLDSGFGSGAYESTDDATRFNPDEILKQQDKRIPNGQEIECAGQSALNILGIDYPESDI